jgi:glycosyltransferase involved in cell wall biosynthesis
MNKKSIPLVTIITVVYNDVKNLEKTINSVLMQNYKNYEYIIIDGLSTDGSLDVIKKYGNKIDKWISEDDNGIYHAMNKAIDISSGTYLCFMNSGDQFLDSDILNLFNNNLDSSDIYYSDVLINGVSKYECNIKKNKFIHQSIIYKKIIHDRIGYYFDLKNFLLSDYLFFLTSKEFKWKKLPFVICNFNNEGVSVKKWYLHFSQKLAVDLIFGNNSALKSGLLLILYPIYRVFLRPIILPIRRFMSYLIVRDL